MFFRIPWLDREKFVSKIEHLQKDNALLNMKIEELVKKNSKAESENPQENIDMAQKYQVYYIHTLLYKIHIDVLFSIISMFSDLKL